MGDTSKHSDFAPSSLARLEQCPASWRLSRDFESLGSADAQRGTDLHAEVAKSIQEGLTEPESPEARKCVAWLRTVIHDGDDLAPERRVSYRSFSGDEVYFGTADLVVTRKDGSVLLVDWKFGSAFVPAVGNLQLAAYACALYQEMNKDGMAPEKVSCAIFQPAVSDEPAIWDGIDIYNENARVQEVIAMCKTVDPGIRAGDHCRYCPAGQNGACPLCTSKVASLSQALARNTQPLSVQCVATSTDETLASWMEALEMAEAFGKAVKEEFARRLSNAGKDGLCGWKLQTARGALKVKDPVQLLLDIQDTVKVSASDFLEVATVSPKKVADLLKGKADGKEKAKEYEALAQELCEKWGERGSETTRIVRCKR